MENEHYQWTKFWLCFHLMCNVAYRKNLRQLQVVIQLHVCLLQKYTGKGEKSVKKEKQTYPIDQRLVPCVDSSESWGHIWASYPTHPQRRPGTLPPRGGWSRCLRQRGKIREHHKYLSDLGGRYNPEEIHKLGFLRQFKFSCFVLGMYHIKCQCQFQGHILRLQ